MSSLSPRIIMRIELRPAAKKSLDLYATRAGKTNVGALSAIVESFARLKPEVQALFIGDIPTEIEADYTRMLLEKLSGATS